MFRGTAKQPITEKNFGVGSVIVGHDDSYLVVGSEPRIMAVTLVRLSDFTTFLEVLNVENTNYLSETEARTLVNICLPDAFSDYTLNAKGLKFQKFKF